MVNLCKVMLNVFLLLMISRFLVVDSCKVLVQLFLLKAARFCANNLSLRVVETNWSIWECHPCGVPWEVPCDTDAVFPIQRIDMGPIVVPRKQSPEVRIL